jgi:XTP/dITP diphosphohydrolase
MKRFIVATNNIGKIKELYAILGNLEVELLRPIDVGLNLEVEETGQTYADNAKLKAQGVAQASGLISLGDDSGLEVEALGGAPGLYSARYAGEGASDAVRRAKLLEALRPFPAPRPARFRCALAVAVPAMVGQLHGELRVFEGSCEGEIVFEERGHNGFGYDPIFYISTYQRTMAELPEETKNQISHRARAAQAAWPYLQSLLGNKV